MWQLQFVEKGILPYFAGEFEPSVIVRKKFRRGSLAGKIETLRAGLRENDRPCLLDPVKILGAESSAPKHDLVLGCKARMEGKDSLLFDFTHSGHYSEMKEKSELVL